MFTAKWKKEAKLLHKGAQKFLNYKRDKLSEERIGEIQSRQADLLKAMKDGDREACTAAEKQLTNVCEKALPSYRHPGWIEENLEVFFVAIVVALGIRAYYLQPFRIPTGSMQPTLNGITGEYRDKATFPSFPVRMAESVLRGRSYIHEELDRPRTFRFEELGRSIEQKQKANFFTYTYLHFQDGDVRIHAPMNVVLKEFGLADKLQLRNRVIGKQSVTVITNKTLPAGTVLASGIVDSGDLVLVDKVSYNFRRPDRSEVWVFDTRGIEGIHRRSGPQGAGSHYIKRLAGIPGDTLQIKPPLLYVNGKLPKEKKLRDVMDRTGTFSDQDDNVGYELAKSGGPGTSEYPNRRYIDREDTVLKLKMDAPPGYREYFSLGDNTDNSLDSRYWGPVHEYNVVGPALFSLWPVTTGHWGLIH